MTKCAEILCSKIPPCPNTKEEIKWIRFQKPEINDKVIVFRNMHFYKNGIVSKYHTTYSTNITPFNPLCVAAPAVSGSTS